MLITRDNLLVSSWFAALRHTLVHEVKENELTSRYTVLINEATGEVASKYGT
jgi:hypothetical protein